MQLSGSQERGFRFANVECKRSSPFIEFLIVFSVPLCLCGKKSSYFSIIPTVIDSPILRCRNLTGIGSRGAIGIAHRFIRSAHQLLDFAGRYADSINQ